MTIRNRISTFDWHSCFNRDIDIYAANFTREFMSLCDLCIPSKVVTIRKNDLPWFQRVEKIITDQRRRAYN